MSRSSFYYFLLQIIHYMTPNSLFQIVGQIFNVFLNTVLNSVNTFVNSNSVYIAFSFCGSRSYIYIFFLFIIQPSPTTKTVMMSLKSILVSIRASFSPCRNNFKSPYLHFNFFSNRLFYLHKKQS